MTKSKSYNLSNPQKMLISLGGTFTVAALGSWVTLPSISSWYLSLAKPFFNPPNWIFGPVWTVLFIMMAIAWYIVWTNKKHHQTVKAGGELFTVQLVLNFCWSFLFFFLQNPFLALIDIVLLWGAILATLISFWRVSPLAGKLMIPYLGWVSFAAVLNGAIVILNMKPSL